MTSWRHSMTHPNLFSLSQLVDVLERWFFFCFYETLGCWVRKCCQFCICMMTSLSWRHVMTSKTGGTLSQLVEVLERWFFFCFYSFPARLVWKCYRFCVLHDVMTSWRDVMTSQNSFPLISACRCSKMMIHMYFCRYFGWWVTSFHRVCICMMSLYHNLTSWRH